MYKSFKMKDMNVIYQYFAYTIIEIGNIKIEEN